MKTKQDFTKYYKEHGLLKTIDDFCEYVSRNYTVSPTGTFAHIALDDYNLSDGHLNFCLESDQIREWFYQAYKDNLGYAVDYTSDNTWENYRWYELIEATEIIILFLEWLKTIPIEVRDHLDGYWGKL